MFKALIQLEIKHVFRILLGLCNEKLARRDEFITEELTNHLFQVITINPHVLKEPRLILQSPLKICITH